jgi:hypothetical protein
VSGSTWNPEDAPAAEIDFSAGILPGTTQQADPWQSGVAGSSGVSLGTGTGQHGTVPTEGLMSNGLVQPVLDFLNRPFATPLNKTDVFLLVGSVLIAVLLWNLILFHIRIAAESI